MSDQQPKSLSYGALINKNVNPNILPGQLLLKIAIKEFQLEIK
jgi:hypothetical protein